MKPGPIHNEDRGWAGTIAQRKLRQLCAGKRVTWLARCRHDSDQSVFCQQCVELFLNTRRAAGIHDRGCLLKEIRAQQLSW